MYRAALFVLLLVGSAHADDTDAPVHYNGGGITVFSRTDTNTAPLAVGDNAIGSPVTFACHSAAGCTVTMIANARFDDPDGYNSMCIYLDGKVAPPGCDPQDTYDDNRPYKVIEQSKVRSGRHSISLVVHVLNAGSSILSFVENYTVYELKVKGAD
jgi:hypothetical protein